MWNGIVNDANPEYGETNDFSRKFFLNIFRVKFSAWFWMRARHWVLFVSRNMFACSLGWGLKWQAIIWGGSLPSGPSPVELLNERLKSDQSTGYDAITTFVGPTLFNKLMQEFTVLGHTSHSDSLSSCMCSNTINSYCKTRAEYQVIWNWH